MSDSSFNENRELAGFRKELRQRLIAAREALPPTARARAGAAIHRALKDLLAGLPVTRVAFCWPFRGEFDARPLMKELIADGVRAALPVVAGAGQPLMFREWTPQSAMVDDRYGIHIPESGRTLLPQLILMPVNAFDARGFRLGYGGGYFDRTLAGLRPAPLAIGVGFELARVESIRPQNHDQRMDVVVTEAGVFVPETEVLTPVAPAAAAGKLRARLPG